MGLNWPREPLVVRQEKLRSWDWVVKFGLLGLSWGLLKLRRSPWGDSAVARDIGNLLKRVAEGALLTGVTVIAGARPGLGVRSRGSGEARLRWRQGSAPGPGSRLRMLLTMEGVGGRSLTLTSAFVLLTREL